MAISYEKLKCDQCGGQLERISNDLWECRYCGTKAERKESYDGVYSIKGVVKQALLDTAYRKLDSARTNLVECEKIDPKYVGTLIAMIAYELICVSSPETCDPNDRRSLYARLKSNCKQLQELGSSVTDDEAVLYEYLESSDIFATLLLVYDSVNDMARRDYVAQLMDVNAVYSKPANTNLLSYSIKNEQFELTDQVLSNADNLDVFLALNEVLDKYPDNENKAGHIEKLFATGEIEADSKSAHVIDEYLTSSGDSVKNKAKVLIAALNSGIKIGVERVLSTVLPGADAEQAQAVLACQCKARLNDEDVLRVMAFAYECGKFELAVVALKTLKESGQYVTMSAKYIIAMLALNAYTAEQKVALMELSFAFKVENKAFESIVSNYLCFVLDDAATRKVILDCLFEKATTFPTALVEAYVLKCSADGERKPEVIGQMFGKGLNVTYFNDLLSRYMRATIDAPPVKVAVVNTLIAIGLKVDPAAFMDYICDSPDDVQSKMNFIGKMVRNGVQIRSDAANRYLEKTTPENFSSELFATIFTPVSSFSAKAIENYVLRFKEREAIKAKNIKTILDLSSGTVSQMACQITHLNNSVSCNLLQAYLLTTGDNQTVAFDVVNYLINTQRLKINAEMRVSGAKMKLKKYVVANKGSLSETTHAICEKYKVYSMFF